MPHNTIIHRTLTTLIYHSRFLRQQTHDEHNSTLSVFSEILNTKLQNVSFSKNVEWKKKKQIFTLSHLLVNE